MGNIDPIQDIALFVSNGRGRMEFGLIGPIKTAARIVQAPDLMATGAILLELLRPESWPVLELLVIAPQFSNL
jgi:hypothetical protein